MIAGVSITTLLLVLAAGIGAGFVGYAVGASSLISYPALLAFGIPPVLSNTTNTVGVCGTGIGGLLSARRELRGQGVRVAVYACIGLVGGIIGGLLLLELPAEVFECAVPPLILFSAIIIALNPRKKAAARDAVAQALPQSHQGERAARIASKTASGTLRRSVVAVGRREFSSASIPAISVPQQARLPWRFSTWVRSVRSIRLMR